jgi:major membrane immunogen (membrane-anchored lipoprotein)
MDRVKIYLTALMLIVTTMLLGACDDKGCKEGAVRENSYRENTYQVCVDGKWKTYTNPQKPDHRTDV